MVLKGYESVPFFIDNFENFQLCENNNIFLNLQLQKKDEMFIDLLRLFNQSLTTIAIINRQFAWLIVI